MKYTIEVRKGVNSKSIVYLKDGNKTVDIRFIWFGLFNENLYSCGSEKFETEGEALYFASCDLYDKVDDFEGAIFRLFNDIDMKCAFISHALDVRIGRFYYHLTQSISLMKFKSGGVIGRSSEIKVNGKDFFNGQWAVKR